MSEERKHAILFAATLLCARRLIDMQNEGKPNFTKTHWINCAVNDAVEILEAIDKKFPTKQEAAASSHAQ